MAADQAILREYLVALGFKIDQSGAKTVNTFLTGTDKKAMALAKTLTTLATTVVASTTVWARQMEKMYYSSRYAETTVERLQELEYGARNIGLEAGKGAAALKNMTAAIRANPGLEGLLNSLGVEVKGRDKADVMMDLVKALRTMPPFIAQKYAAMFGIDPETLFNLEAGLEKMQEAGEARKKMAEDMGYDADQAAASAKEYMTLWREVTERAGMFGSILATAILPYVKELVFETDKLMIKWAHIVKDLQDKGAGDFWQKMREGFTGKAEGGGVQLSEESKRRLGLSREEQTDLRGAKGVGIPRLMQQWEKWRDERHGGYRFGSRLATDQDAVDAVGDMSDFKGAGNGQLVAGDAAALDGEEGTNPGVNKPIDAKEYLASLEKRYGLPNGVLDRVWSAESNRGIKMLSKAGAKGHFGFMDATAKQYGLKDPNDFQESADAAARKYSDLLQHYHGDLRKAAAAYNWGDGNLDRYGLGKAPAETRGYMDKVAGPQSVTIQANPEINIYGVTDPRKAAEEVASRQREVNGDITRNFSPKVR
jgi:hypothetical protein